MLKNYVNIKELSIIVNCGINTLYFSNDIKEYLKNKKINKEYRIYIDDFLEDRKIFKFKFYNEYENKSFIIRMLRKANIEELPNELKTKDILSFTNMTYQKLKTLREKDIIKYRIEENKNYSINAKGRFQYIYDKESVIKYLIKKNFNTSKEQIIYSKQFYSTTETIEILQKNNINISLKTLYRYIYNYNLIPAVKIGGKIYVPIIEFHKLELKKIFKN